MAVWPALIILEGRNAQLVLQGSTPNLEVYAISVQLGTFHSLVVTVNHVRTDLFQVCCARSVQNVLPARSRIETRATLAPQIQPLLMVLRRAFHVDVGRNRVRERLYVFFVIQAFSRATMARVNHVMHFKFQHSQVHAVATHVLMERIATPNQLVLHVIRDFSPKEVAPANNVPPVKFQPPQAQLHAICAIVEASPLIQMYRGKVHAGLVLLVNSPNLVLVVRAVQVVKSVWIAEHVHAILVAQELNHSDSRSVNFVLLARFLMTQDHAKTAHQAVSQVKEQPLAHRVRAELSRILCLHVQHVVQDNTPMLKLGICAEIARKIRTRPTAHASAFFVELAKK